MTEEKFKCEICGKWFETMDELKGHMEKEHPEEKLEPAVEPPEEREGVEEPPA